jgi:hypothetical protein
MGRRVYEEMPISKAYYKGMLNERRAEVDVKYINITI